MKVKTMQHNKLNVKKKIQGNNDPFRDILIDKLWLCSKVISRALIPPLTFAASVPW